MSTADVVLSRLKGPYPDVRREAGGWDTDSNSPAFWWAFVVPRRLWGWFPWWPKTVATIRQSTVYAHTHEAQLVLSGL